MPEQPRHGPGVPARGSLGAGSGPGRRVGEVGAHPYLLDIPFSALDTVLMADPDSHRLLAPVLRGDGILLRPADDGDIDARLALENDPEILRMFGVSWGQIGPLSRAAAERWVRRLRDHPHAWVIVTDRVIGEIRLDNIDRTDRRASLAIGILDPGSLGRGFGTRAIRLVLGYAFETLTLHRVAVRVLAYNARAIRAYEKCGFVVEGREREAALVDGAWHDDVIMGVLDAEFRQKG